MSSSQNQDNKDKVNKSLTTGEIVGIIIGVIAILTLLGIFLYLRKLKKDLVFIKENIDLLAPPFGKTPSPSPSRMY